MAMYASRPGRVPRGASLPASRSAVLAELLADRTQQGVDAVAVLVEERGVVVALGDAQRGALGNHVDDLRIGRGVGHHPLDVDGRVVRPFDDGGNQLAGVTILGGADGETNPLVLADL